MDVVLATAVSLLPHAHPAFQYDPHAISPFGDSKLLLVPHIFKATFHTEFDATRGNLNAALPRRHEPGIWSDAQRNDAIGNNTGSSSRPDKHAGREDVALLVNDLKLQHAS
jgi:hypothetical protein